MWQPCHPSKCSVLRLGKHVIDYELSDSNGNLMTVQQTNTEKDLGILIDNKLNFCDYVDKIVSGANQSVGLIRRLIRSLDKDIFVLLFKTLIHPKLEYNNTVWNPDTKRDNIKLESVQRRATKMLPGLTYPDRLKLLNLPTFCD